MIIPFGYITTPFPSRKIKYVHYKIFRKWRKAIRK